MNDEELLDMNVPETGDNPEKPTTYERLVRQSRKLGGVAVRTFSDVRRALNQEVTFHPTTHLREKLAQRTNAKYQKELEDAATLKKTVKKAHEMLANVQTVFPLTLFPDSIVVDRTKVSIRKRSFFLTSNTISFQIEDILNVSCGTGPIFGSLTIASRVMSTVDHFQVDRLWRADAIFLKHLIQGHIIAKNNKLETDQLSVEEMIETLCELGLDADV